MSGLFTATVTPATPTPQVATWTNASANGETIEISTNGMSGVLVFVDEASVSGGLLTFNASMDFGVTFPIGPIPIDLTIEGQASTNSHAGGAGDKLYGFNVAAYTHLRVTLTTKPTSGTFAVRMTGTSTWGHGILYVRPATTTATFGVDTELPAPTLLADGAPIPTTPTVGAVGLLLGPGILNFHREIAAGNDLPGTGVATAGLMAQLDDVATSTVTEGNFGNLRMSQRRALLVEGVASGTVIPVSDGGGSLTVDAPVGTPVFVRLSDGSAAITTLPVSLASVPTHAVTQSGAWTVTADTELPPSAALADATANPTVPGVGAFGMVWDSLNTLWNRIPGDAVGVYVSGPSGGSVSCNTEISGTITPADALTNSTAMGQVLVRPEGFNGATWDRLRSNPTTFSRTVSIEDGSVSGRYATVTVGGLLRVDASSAIQPVKEVRSATSTAANVSASATNVTVMASNANRLGGTIYNDSTSIAYLKLGATASATSFTVVLRGNSSGVGGYYEIPFGYTGIVDMIWVTATGSARVVEFT